MLGLTDQETHDIGNLLTILGLAAPFAPKLWEFFKKVRKDIIKMRSK